MIEEHPAEARFGLASGDAGEITDWRDLRWADLDPADLRATHLEIDGPLTARRPTGSSLRWGSSAADQAAITLRRPTRIAIHGSRLIPVEAR